MTSIYEYFFKVLAMTAKAPAHPYMMRRPTQLFAKILTMSS